MQDARFLLQTYPLFVASEGRQGDQETEKRGELENENEAEDDIPQTVAVEDETVARLSTRFLKHETSGLDGGAEIDW